MKKLILGLALCAALGGCASVMLSDSHIISDTAGVLGVQPDALSISNRRTEGTNTYYTATVSDGRTFHCVINGGNALTMGMTNPPACAKPGQPLPSGPTGTGR